jgi:hypothetical protein
MVMSFWRNEMKMQRQSGARSWEEVARSVLLAEIGERTLIEEVEGKTCKVTRGYEALFDGRLQ